MEERLWNIYLSGEVHTDWRAEIHRACEERQVPVRLLGPECDHDTRDQCGDKILGPEADSFWRDHKAARINAIRNRGVMGNCDIVIARFGDKYRQWETAFDAGTAVALGKSLVTLHDKSLDHALKEVDAAALATCRSVGEVVDVLAYVTSRPF
jgi:YtoQ family protein